MKDVLTNVTSTVFGMNVTGQRALSAPPIEPTNIQNIPVDDGIIQTDTIFNDTL